MSKRVLTVCGLAAAALVLRVMPAWPVVFSGGAVSFQEGDAWFHVRTVHNLLAHFPWRSGFDPYVLFPSGQNIPTGPLWDYLLATAAWVLSFGSPSAGFVDRVAAWMPAILGAFYVFPVYFLARRLFGEAAATFAALWAATLPGGFLWLTHLGLADHHAAEGLFAFLTMALLCAALDADAARRTRLSALAGVALGAFLATRPAGIFVPAILACAAALEPQAAVPVLIAVATGAVVFLPVTGSQWADYAWLALACAGGVAATSVVLTRWARRRGWRRRAAPIGVAVLVAAGLIAAAALRPALIGSLVFEIRRIAGAEPSSRVVSTVQEMRPIYLAGRQAGWVSVVDQLGTVWIPALPMLAWVAWRAMRAKRPALALFAIWSMVMAAGTFLQARMLIYFASVAAILAGAALARVGDLGRPMLRRAVWAVLAAVMLAINLPAAITLMRIDNSPGTDWVQAALWLRANTPEPFADGGVWSRYYPREANGAVPAPSAAWGVAVWWEDGYPVEQIGHRVPMSNGTQAGAEEMARFLTETSGNDAVSWLRAAGARYVAIGPSIPLFAGANASRFPAVLETASRDLRGYFRLLIDKGAGEERRVPVYLPAYYRTMMARLYLAEGAEVKGSGPWLFSADEDDQIQWSGHFESEQQASEYMAAHPFDQFVEGCLDPGASCFDLPAVPGLRHVYSSDPLPISRERTVRAVKIFEVY